MARISAGFLFFVLLLTGSLPAVTLLQLSTDDLINQSTSILRCRILGSYASTQSGEIYTHYKLRVTENWKGPAITDIALPGGSAGGARQSVAGVPRLQEGREYVLYLWTSATSGLTFVTGFQQGIFTVGRDATGASIVERAANSEMMLNAHGKPATAMPLRTRLQDMLTHVNALAAHGAAR